MKIKVQAGEYRLNNKEGGFINYLFDGKEVIEVYQIDKLCSHYDFQIMDDKFNSFPLLNGIFKTAFEIVD